MLLSNPFLCGFFSRGIFFVTKGTFGQLTCEWQYLFEEFTKDPMIVEDRRLRIEAKVQKQTLAHQTLAFSPQGLHFIIIFFFINKQVLNNYLADYCTKCVVLCTAGESEVCLPCQGVWKDHKLQNSRDSQGMLTICTIRCSYIFRLYRYIFFIVNLLKKYLTVICCLYIITLFLIPFVLLKFMFP